MPLWSGLAEARRDRFSWERWKNGQSVLAVAPRALEWRNKTGVQRFVAPWRDRCRRRVAELWSHVRERRSCSGNLNCLGARSRFPRGIAAGRSVRRIAYEVSNDSPFDDQPGDVDLHRRFADLPCKLGREERSSASSGRCALSLVAWRLHVELRHGAWRMTLALQWSPEQISGWLKQPFPYRPRHADSRLEAIYPHVSSFRRAACLRTEICTGTSCAQGGRCVTRKAARPRWTGAHTDMVSIRDRPAEAEDRAVPGPLGRRSSYRSKRHAHRDARRTPQPLYDARQASKEGHDDRGCRAR